MILKLPHAFKKRCLKLSAAALLLSPLATVTAADFDYSKQWGLGGSVGQSYPVFGNQFNDSANRDFAYNLHLRYHYNQKLGVELGYNKTTFDQTNQELETLELLSLYRFAGDARFSPIAGLGLGVADLTNTNENSLKFTARARAGVQYSITAHLMAQLTVDYQWISKMPFASNLDQGHLHLITPQIGLTWYFGPCSSKKPIQAATTTIAVPAPIQAVVATIDGDDDQDGVLNSKDKCPQTTATTKVNAYGCSTEEKANISINILFPTNRTEIPADYQKEVELLAQFLKDHSHTTAEIQGHTDSQGAKEDNLKLSQQRAESVKQALINDFGINSNRLTAKGYGDSNPLNDNQSVEGRKNNRRVVAVITDSAE